MIVCKYERNDGNWKLNKYSATRKDYKSSNAIIFFPFVSIFRLQGCERDKAFQNTTSNRIEIISQRSTIKREEKINKITSKQHN